MSGNEWLCGLVAVLVIAAVSTMFSDSLRGSVDMASAKMKYLYEKTASTVLGGPDLGELTLHEQVFLPQVKNKYVGGLYNEGNTCFINSVVQSLSSCDKLLAYLEKLEEMKLKRQHTEKDHDNREGKSRAEVDLRANLLMLFRALNTKKSSSHNYSTEKLTHAIAKLTNWKYDMYNQEDAQEFFQQILLGLEKELQQNNLPFEKNKANTPFDGTSAIRVGCVKCGETEGIRNGVVSSIDLTLSERDYASIQLEELLDDYVAMETIPEVECYRCSLIGYKAELEKRIKGSSHEQDSVDEDESERSGEGEGEGGSENAGSRSNMLLGLYQTRITQISKALEAKVIDDKQYAILKPKSLKQLGDKTKQVMFAEPLADVLMIHINRSVFDMRTGYSVKNYTPVVFPMRLDMRPYIVGDVKQNEDPSKPMAPDSTADEDTGVYDLRASVLHYGSHNFGHYLCFRKCDQGMWWRISDDSVNLSTEAQVLKCQGIFMLFYQRVTREELQKEVEERTVLLEQQLALHKELQATNAEEQKTQKEINEELIGDSTSPEANNMDALSEDDGTSGEDISE